MTDQHSRPFAEILYDRRRQLGLSQREAARQVGASEKSWRRWEKGGAVDERFHDAIREQFGIVAGAPTTPEVEIVKAVEGLEHALATVRASLDRATNVRADMVLQRNDGTTVLIEVKAFSEGSAGALEDEIVDLVTAAAHDAGWTVHVTP